MTMKRKGEAWMPADAYGRALPKFTVNLMTRDVQRALPFYRDVLGARVLYADEDFAALELQLTQFMLHADHAYDHHPMAERLNVNGPRGTGVELRVMGIDPDKAQARARAAKVRVVQPARDFPHGWRDVMLEDPDGYVWAVGVAI
jgi:catechol 2,3-dioxygenase-like lactoylglutathione lyase family enzyme